MYDGTDFIAMNDVLMWEMITGLTYIVGTQFYIWKIPERFAPGMFDFWV